MAQRPELFGAAIPAVGVMDMLRYHKFTIGWMWKSDYMSSDTKEGFENLITYSPLHTLKPGVKYPLAYITTSTKDDRVHPGHARKFAARLAEVGAPYLYFENTDGGHANGADPAANAKR